MTSRGNGGRRVRGSGAGGSRALLSGLLVALALFAMAAGANAGESVAGFVDIGIGAGRTEPYIVGGAVSATVGLGACARLAGPATAGLELRVIAGGEPAVAQAPENARAGRQSLTTLLAGLELVSSRSLRAPFATAGIGIGRSTISGARGPTGSSNFGAVPLRCHTGLAYGMGLGLRTRGGPGPWGMLFAIRTQGLLRDGATRVARFTHVTVGLAF